MGFRVGTYQQRASACHFDTYNTLARCHFALARCHQQVVKFLKMAVSEHNSIRQYCAYVIFAILMAEIEFV